MEIFKYIDYFQDGSIVNIQDDGKVIQFLIESAEVEKEAFEKSVPLSRENRIQGIVHIEEIEEVSLDNQMAKRPSSQAIDMYVLLDDLLKQIQPPCNAQKKRTQEHR